MFNYILCEEDVYQGKGSGFTLEKIDGVFLCVYKYIAMSGSSYMSLPSGIENKKSYYQPTERERTIFQVGHSG